MPSVLKKQDIQEIVDTAIESFAQIVNGAFVKQNDMITQQLDQKLEQQKTEILEEIDSRGYITKQDLDTRGYVTNQDLDARGYVTKHDLDDAILDLKDSVTDRITRLEQKVR